MFFGEGTAVWMELKRPDGKGVVSSYQEREHARMREHDIPVFVVDNVQDAIDILAIYFPNSCEI